MAIFPLYNKHATNYPAKVNENFTSGMALVIDSSGNAIKADRSNVSYNSIFEGYGKFIGFASGDHTNISSVLMSDPVGSNYISSDNKFVDNVNSHYSASKRSISEFKDESISGVLFSEYSKRGIGVFNLQGEIYITDQFARVESLFIDSDGTAQVNFNVGDLLTYGAGINAGKLVKVDTSAISPSVLIIGVVEKFDSASNLLYFRHVLESYNNTVSFVASNLSMNLDASNPTSYPGTGTVWYDLSGNGLNGALVNGVSFTNNYFSFDGSNDYIEVLDNDLLDFPGDFTVETVYRNDGNFNLGILSKFWGGTAIGTWAFSCFYGDFGVREFFWDKVGSGGNSLSSSPKEVVIRNRWNHFLVTRISGIKYMYIDGVLASSGADSYDYTGYYNLCFCKWGGSGYLTTPTLPTGIFSNGSMMLTRIYKGLGLTSEQVRQNYNSSMGKLI